MKADAAARGRGYRRRPDNSLNRGSSNSGKKVSPAHLALSFSFPILARRPGSDSGVCFRSAET